ncbi:MAG: hypothetical protein AAFZ15_05235 [Bacteroidota bacterium]
MLDKLKKSFTTAGDLIKEQATALGDAAKQKGYSIINDWISILPKMESYGLETTFFSLSVSINPTLEVEMKGDADKFDQEYCEKLIEENKGSTPMNLAFNAIKTTYQLYRQTEMKTLNPLILRIKVRISPEVRVSYGEQITE